MNHTLFFSVASACFASLIPAVAAAQGFGPGEPINCVITRPRPVYTTQLQPRQVTVFRDVAETQMSQQRVIENVPITTCKNVTVDEGEYQMVWVSKPVTKQVAQTVMQQQVKTVAVPVQVCRRIPQTATQMVPVQTVQYVNETVPVQMTGMASNCSSCADGLAMGSPILAPQLGYSSVKYQSPQFSAAVIPTMPAIDLPSYQVPAKSMQRRQSSMSTPDSSEEVVRARGVPAPQDEVIPRPRKTSMFSGVPSAASVWRRQDTSYAR